MDIVAISNVKFQISNFKNLLLEDYMQDFLDNGDYDGNDNDSFKPIEGCFWNDKATNFCSRKIIRCDHESRQEFKKNKNRWNYI